MIEGAGDELLDCARMVASSARLGEQVEGYVTRSRETEIKVFGGEVESLSSAETSGVGVRVLVEGRTGFAWAGTLDPKVVAATVDEARDNAAFGAPDEHAGLAGLADVSGTERPDLELWRDELLSVAGADKVDLALAVEAATLRADARVRGVASAEYSDFAMQTAVVNSLGVEGYSRRTGCSLYSSALAGGDDETQTGFGFSAGRTVTDLDVERAAMDAAERATRLLGAKQPATMRLPVVFDPLVTRSILALLGAALSGEAVLKGRSMFIGRIGEEVAASSVTIVDDPTCGEAFGAAPIDGEGVPTRRTPLISNGVLGGFLQNVYTGRRDGSRTTGSAVRGYGSPPGVGARALAMSPGTLAPEQLMRMVPMALYVQSISGLHSGTSPVSGDFSVGAEGVMVRDGDFAEPIREVTISSTLPRMLLDVVAVGNDAVWLPGGAAGVTLLLTDMTMSGA